MQLLLKLLFLNLPPIHRTWSSSIIGCSEYTLLLCLPLAISLLFTETSEFISSANALLCAILIFFFQQSQFQQYLKVVLVF